MSRLVIKAADGQRVADGLYGDLERRLASAPPGLCPVDLALSFVTVCQAQSCGKCVPCRVGLGQLANLLRDLLDGKASMCTLDLIEQTAATIYDSADCAIGYDAARMVLSNLKAYRTDYIEHAAKRRCLGSFQAPVPCRELCPADVDVPGYIALIAEGRYADAVRLIRKDNPFPVACGYICEHPCESKCRRNLLDDAVNIRGLKRYAVDNAGKVPVPACAPATGKTVAVIGGGPSGLTAAYFLALMGHKVTVFERRKKLGGMLRYGIPAYRFPRELLDRDIEAILSTGIEVRYECNVGTDVAFEDLVKEYDCVYISAGAHTGSKARIEGEDLKGVISAVELLKGIGDGEYPDFTGKTVAVIGGGNVAMDATRTSVRLGASKVYCVYRRRQVDMTALPEEVEGAIAEGAELLTLKAPVRIEGDAEGKAAALWVKPQLSGLLDESGRPSPVNADLPEERIPVDLVIVAVGQKIETAIFEKAGLPVTKGALAAMATGQIFANGKIFAGGDCATNPATAIRAVAGGKVAAANIDNYLGYHHEIGVDVEIPAARAESKPRRGRINTSERLAGERKQDFTCIEIGMTEEGALTEASRCLRCDHYGCGALKGGRINKW